jgi:hypothetical protein
LNKRRSEFVKLTPLRPSFFVCLIAERCATIKIRTALYLTFQLSEAKMPPHRQNRFSTPRLVDNVENYGEISLICQGFLRLRWKTCEVSHRSSVENVENSSPSKIILFRFLKQNASFFSFFDSIRALGFLP